MSALAVLSAAGRRAAGALAARNCAVRTYSSAIQPAIPASQSTIRSSWMAIALVMWMVMALSMAVGTMMSRVVVWLEELILRN